MIAFLHFYQFLPFFIYRTSSTDCAATKCGESQFPSEFQFTYFSSQESDSQIMCIGATVVNSGSVVTLEPCEETGLTFAIFGGLADDEERMQFQVVNTELYLTVEDPANPFRNQPYLQECTTSELAQLWSVYDFETETGYGFTYALGMNNGENWLETAGCGTDIGAEVRLWDNITPDIRCYGWIVASTIAYAALCCGPLSTDSSANLNWGSTPGQMGTVLSLDFGDGIDSIEKCMQIACKQFSACSYISFSSTHNGGSCSAFS